MQGDTFELTAERRAERVDPQEICVPMYEGLERYADNKKPYAHNSSNQSLHAIQARAYRQVCALL